MWITPPDLLESASCYSTELTKSMTPTQACKILNRMVPKIERDQRFYLQKKIFHAFPASNSVKAGLWALQIAQLQIAGKECPTTPGPGSCSADMTKMIV